MIKEFTEEDIEKFLDAYYESISDDQTQSLNKLISVQNRIAIFKDIPPEELRAVVYNLKFIKFKYKDYIIKQNEKTDEIFYIIDGECQVFHDKYRVGQLQAGDIFGETAAIFSTKRNASVLCLSKEATLLSFSIDHNNMEFCAPALAQLYKNLAFEMNAKLEDLNEEYSKK
jgi:CRP-like cAMP-binding protein